MHKHISHAISVMLVLMVGIGAMQQPKKTTPTGVDSAAMIAFPSRDRVVTDEVSVNDEHLEQLKIKHEAWVALHTPPPAPPVVHPLVYVQSETWQRPTYQAPVRAYVQPVAAVFVRPGANHFTWGNCTWYVASRRYVPWFGNASAWPWAASAMGFRLGYTPLVGAIAQYGNHVMYVESVSGNAFTVSEMNYWGVPGGGFDRVDYRTILSSAGYTFIY